MTEQRGLSRRQFAASSFDPDGYVFNEQPGEFVAVIDCKRWGKRKKLITYMTFEDGRRIVATTWPKSNSLGLAELPVGTKVELDFQHTRSGKLNLIGVTMIHIPAMILPS